MKDLQAYFSQQTPHMIDLLRQLVEIESPSTDKGAADRMARFLAQAAQDAGADVREVPVKRRGNHIVARWGEGAGGFLLLSHYDTVWAQGTLAERPWCISGERAYGPGCLDDKSGAVVALAALRGLGEMALEPSRPVTLLFNSDEEIGSRTSRALIETEARRAGVVFCLEPAMPDGSLKVWRKGTGRYTVTTRGRAVHAGSDHQQGINAIEELAHQTIRLQAMTDYTVGSTVNVGWVSGGTRTNVVPAYAQARVDLRVRTADEGLRMDAAIQGLRPVLSGADLTVSGGLSRPPMEEGPVTLEPFRRAREIGADLGLTFSAAGSGGASDANFTAALGVPTLDGLGAVGEGAHSVDEYVSIPSLPERAALMAALVTRW